MRIASIKFSEGLFSESSPIVLIFRASRKNGNSLIRFVIMHDWYKIVNSNYLLLIKDTNFQTDHPISRVFNIFVYKDFTQTVFSSR